MSSRRGHAHRVGAAGGAAVPALAPGALTWCVLTSWLLASWVLALPAGALEWERITLNGYTSFEYEMQIEPEGEGGGDPNGSFDADLFDLVLNFQVTDRLRAAADITWEHGVATEDELGNVALEYGFVEYTVRDLLRLRVGKFLTPFGYFNEIHTAKPAFLSVKEAASTNRPDRIAGDVRRFYPRAGVGVAARGEGLWGGHSFSYDLMLANGDQDETNPFEEDNNTSKAMAGRFRFAPSDAVQLGISLYHDRFTDSAIDSEEAQGLEVEINLGRVRILGEVVRGRQHLTAGGTVERLGAYLQPSYHFDNGVTLYLRYDWVDPDLDIGNDDGASFIVGANYEPLRGFVIKLENNYFHGGPASTLAQYPGRDYNELKAAVVLGF